MNTLFTENANISPQFFDICLEMYRAANNCDSDTECDIESESESSVAKVSWTSDSLIESFLFHLRDVSMHVHPELKDMILALDIECEIPTILDPVCAEYCGSTGDLRYLAWMDGDVNEFGKSEMIKFVEFVFVRVELCNNVIATGFVKSGCVQIPKRMQIYIDALASNKWWIPHIVNILVDSESMSPLYLKENGDIACRDHHATITFVCDLPIDDTSVHTLIKVDVSSCSNDTFVTHYSSVMY